MEPHERIEMVDTLLAEANQHIEVLNRAIAAQDIAQHAAHHTSQPQDHHVLQQEHKWWEAACQGLSEIRNTLAHIEQSERKRGVSA
jgi:hypothetical protein